MKRFYYFGIAAAAIYVFAVVLGGYMWNGYNHISQSISELIMVGSPNQSIMQPLFWAYNILLVVFSIGFFQWAQNRLLKTSAVFLLLVALSGVMMLIFPQDKLGETLTIVGLLHLIFAGFAALSTLVSIFFAAAGFRKVDKYKGLTVMSIVFGLIILVNGPLTAMAPTVFPDYFGLSERVTIGAFIIWLFLVSYKLANNQNMIKAEK